MWLAIPLFFNVEFIALINTNNIPCGVTELFLCDSQFATVFIQFNINYLDTMRFSAVKKWHSINKKHCGTTFFLSILWLQNAQLIIHTIDICTQTL
jgi:hypothetical protein